MKIYQIKNKLQHPKIKRKEEQMGRYLAAAIPTTISIRNREGLIAKPYVLDVKKDTDKILQKVSKINVIFVKFF